MTSEKRMEDKKLDPAEGAEAIRKYFEGLEPAEIVARGEEMTPSPRPWKDGGISLSQLATEVSWQLMLSADDPSKVNPKAAAREGLQFFERLDDTVAFIGTSQDTMAPEVERLGYGTRRFLVSQTGGLRPVLTRLVASEAYVSLRGTLESIISSPAAPNRSLLEDARQKFAGLAVALEEATA